MTERLQLLGWTVTPSGDRMHAVVDQRIGDGGARFHLTACGLVVDAAVALYSMHALGQSLKPCARCVCRLERAVARHQVPA